MKTVGIHQPGYLPWLGFFKKMMNSDIFVFFDDVQYEKDGWQNRNQVRGPNDAIWLIVPVKAHLDSKINQVEIDNSKNWMNKHKKSLSYNYSKAPYFGECGKIVEYLYGKKYELLIDINIEFIKLVMDYLDIKTKTVFSSELQTTKNGSDKILEICKVLNADKYITGTVWAKNHLKIEEFQKANITVEFQEFQHPTYKQIHKGFIPQMSIIDLLFNEGKVSSKQILANAIV